MSGSNPNLDPVQAMLAQTSLQTTLFAPNSRYYNLPTATLKIPDGTTIAYLQRRFCPQPERFQQLQQYTVMQGDRLDNISAKFLGDPTLFWRICDANRALRPEELTATVGRKLSITMPDGIAGTSL
jgi:nucleoid-associated protein YgaU